MANDYYTASSDPANNSDGDPAVIRAEHATIAAGFDKLVPLTASGDKVVTVNTGGTAQTARSLLGTTNQITVTIAAGSYTLSLPQNIHTGATPTFAGLTLTGALGGTAGVFSGALSSAGLVATGAVSTTTKMDASAQVAYTISNWNALGWDGTSTMRW